LHWHFASVQKFIYYELAFVCCMGLNFVLWGEMGHHVGPTVILLAVVVSGLGEGSVDGATRNVDGVLKQLVTCDYKSLLLEWICPHLYPHVPRH